MAAIAQRQISGTSCLQFFQFFSVATMYTGAAETEASHKSHHALDKYPTPMCTFMSQNGAVWDMELVHCGMFATGLLTLLNLNYKQYFAEY